MVLKLDWWDTAVGVCSDPIWGIGGSNMVRGRGVGERWEAGGFIMTICRMGGGEHGLGTNCGDTMKGSMASGKSSLMGLSRGVGL